MERGETSTTIIGKTNIIYTFNANAGQALTLTIKPLGADVNVMLYDVNKKPLISKNLGFEGSKEHSYSCILNQTGIYYILGSSDSNTYLYQFTLSIK